ncbi:hypothetical protein Trco_003071 [Trichoderma cornu-damae]|uniref:Clock-controlled protein 6 n=1 Tax=Trichoderma cornu-damae TaxID=654480 RepID=A0A9P8QNY6_9HYPO|nr:hypothetical protein Trco_003071 [Trichoderma cornu-damae]
MKFAAAFVLAAVGVSAVYVVPSNVTVVTEVVDSYTTFCPYATQITHGSVTYSVTEATTLTVTNCPCTITRPVTTTSSVLCNSCGTAAPTGAPPAGGNGGSVPPAFTNSTISTPTHATPVGNPPAGSTPPGNAPAGTGSFTQPPTSAIPTGGASKAVLSGAGLAGIVGLAAFVL